MLEENHTKLDDLPQSFSFNEKKDFYLFQLFQELETEEYDRFYQIISKVIQSPKNVIVDILYLEDISIHYVMVFNILKLQIQVNGCHFHFYNLTPDFKEKLSLLSFDIEGSELTDLYNAIALYQTSKDPGPMTFLRSSALSTARTFLVQMQLPCTRKKTYFKQESKDQFIGDATALVKVEGDNYHYYFCLSFSNKTFLKIMSRMLSEDISEVTDDIKDGTAEILSIITGQSKALLADREDKITTSIPIPYFNKKCPILTNAKGEKEYFSDMTTFVIPFGSKFGEINIEIVFPKEYSTDKINEILIK